MIKVGAVSCGHEAGDAGKSGDAEPSSNLTRYAEEKGLGTRERLRLMVKICDAVQHAHAKGIVHLDLKPVNILDSARRGRRRSPGQ